MMNECFYNYVSQNNPTFLNHQNWKNLIIKILLKNHGAPVGIESHNTTWATFSNDNIKGATREKMELIHAWNYFLDHQYKNSNKQIK